MIHTQGTAKLLLSEHGLTCGGVPCEILSGRSELVISLLQLYQP